MSDVHGAQFAVTPVMKWSAEFVAFWSRMYLLVTQVTVTPTHSPLPPLKLPNDPRPTLSMKPHTKLPSGMKWISLRL